MLTQRETWKEREIEGDRNRNQIHMMALAVWVCKQSIERNNMKMLTQRET